MNKTNYVYMTLSNGNAKLEIPEKLDGSDKILLSKFVELLLMQMDAAMHKDEWCYQI